MELVNSLFLSPVMLFGISTLRIRCEPSSSSSSPFHLSPGVTGVSVIVQLFRNCFQSDICHRSDALLCRCVRGSRLPAEALLGAELVSSWDDGLMSRAAVVTVTAKDINIYFSLCSCQMFIFESCQILLVQEKDLNT